MNPRNRIKRVSRASTEKAKCESYLCTFATELGIALRNKKVEAKKGIRLHIAISREYDLSQFFSLFLSHFG